MDQRVTLRKDNVWYDGNFIFSITTLVELQRKYLYYIATQTQCVQTESCSSVIKIQISILYSLYCHQPLPEPISYNIQLFYFNVVAVTGLSGGMSH